MGEIATPTQRKPHKVGLGFRKHDLRRIVVSFDEDTFREVYTRARQQRTSFAEQVRILVEQGLMADDA